MTCNRVLAFLFLFVPLAFFSIQELDRSGALYAFQGDNDGADGTHGENGDPGADGTNGESGTDIWFGDTSAIDYFHIYGGSGGKGGNGGHGVDGDDDDSWATGGHGGYGGNGGNSTINLNGKAVYDIFSIGGHGGDGGRMGMGTDRTLNGNAGNGGHGGISRVTVTGTETYDGYKFIRSHGGYGGAAYGVGATGGNGGRATLNGEFIASNYSRSNFVLSGGRGGHGWEGADGGNGAVATFGFGGSSLTSVASEGRRKYLTLDITGGAGGNSQNGNGGVGATARLHMDTLRKNTTENAFHSSIFNVRAGSGGKGVSTGTQAANGGRGSVALVHAGDAITPISESGNFYTTFRIYGGNGGSAIGRRGAGDGGYGGRAGFQGRQIIDTTQHSGNTNQSVQANVYGGDGGHAQGSGRAGNGGDVTYDNNFVLKTRHQGDFFFNGRGGNGGWGRNNGFGGDVNISSTNLFDPSVENINPDYKVNQTFVGYGGHAGRGVTPERVAHGGDARIEVSQTGTRSRRVNGWAYAGQGNWGKSGDVYSDVESIVVNGPTEPVSPNDSEAWAHAVRRPIWTTRAATGTDAFARSRAESENGSSRTWATAQAGYGFLESGKADASSTAIGHLDATANSSSHGFGDRNLDTDNHSATDATAIGNRMAVATSRAWSNGKVEYTSARGLARGKQASSLSTVSTETTNWRSSSSFQMNAEFTGENPGTASTAASSRFVTNKTLPAENTSIEAHVNLMPMQPEADEFVAMYTAFSDTFVDDRSADILGIGTIMGGMEDGDVGTLETSAEFDFALESRHWFDDKKLMFGLNDMGMAGDGFSQLDIKVEFGDRVLIDESFTDGNAAMDYFDNILLDLGSTPLDRELIEFSFDVDMLFENAGDEFGLAFVFGNAGTVSSGPLSFIAVPEPGSAGLAGLFCLIAALRRKRQSNPA